MTTQINFFAGLPAYAVNALLVSVLDNGVLSGSGTQVTLTYLDLVLTFTGTGLTTGGARLLTAGQIDTITFSKSGVELFEAGNYSAPVSYTRVQQALTFFDITPSPTQDQILDVSAALFLSEYTQVSGSGDADVLFGGDLYRTDIYGGGGNDSLTGGAGADTLNGGAGNDTLTGGGGGNTLTGGADQDSFRFLVRDHAIDNVTDFVAADDTLVFAASAFDVNGAAFDTRTVAASTATDITGADLVIWTGGVLNTAADVQAYLAAANGGSAGEGLFIAGTNAGGQAVLFHTTDASGASNDVDFITTLGTLTAANSIQLNDLAFV